jgi:hypothetical protein
MPAPEFAPWQLFIAGLQLDGPPPQSIEEAAVRYAIQTGNPANAGKFIDLVAAGTAEIRVEGLFPERDDQGNPVRPAPTIPEESAAAYILRSERERDAAGVGDGTPGPIPDPLPPYDLPPVPNDPYPDPDTVPLPRGTPPPPAYGIGFAYPSPAHERADDFLDNMRVARVTPNNTPPRKIPGPRGEPSTAEDGEFSGDPSRLQPRTIWTR